MRNLVYLSIFVLVLATQSCTPEGNTGEFAEYEMYNARAPMANLVTGGQPSLADLKMFSDRGVRVVVNLRTKGEFKKFNEKEAVEKLGMTYVSIEIDGSDGITQKNAELLDKALDNLSQPALVHCASSNRVGGLLAYRAFSIQNKIAEDAIAFGRSAGMTSTEKRVKKLIGSK